MIHQIKEILLGTVKNSGAYNDGTSLYCARCSCEKPYVITGNSNKINKSVHRADVWICPNCGRENQNYVGSCGCGEVKPK